MDRRQTALNYLRTVIAADAEDISEATGLTTKEAGILLRDLYAAGEVIVAMRRDSFNLDGKKHWSPQLWAIKDNA